MTKKISFLIFLIVSYCQIYAIDLTGVWSCGVLRLSESKESEDHSWGLGKTCDYGGFVIDELNGNPVVDIKGLGSYYVTEMTENNGIIKFSFDFYKANKKETYYLKMLSDYELVFVGVDTENTTMFFESNNGDRFYRLAGPTGVALLKTPYLAKVNSKCDVMFDGKVVARVKKGQQVQILGINKSESLDESNSKKKFHVLIDGATGGYIEGKYLDILSEQVIY